MKSGYKSRIEVNPDTGRKFLIVFYDSEIDNFDAAITQAIAFHNIRDGPYECDRIPLSMNTSLSYEKAPKENSQAAGRNK